MTYSYLNKFKQKASSLNTLPISKYSEVSQWWIEASNRRHRKIYQKLCSKSQSNVQQASKKTRRIFFRIKSLHVLGPGFWKEMLPFVSGQLRALSSFGFLLLSQRLSGNLINRNAYSLRLAPREGEGMEARLVVLILCSVSLSRRARALSFLVFSVQCSVEF